MTVELVSVQRVAEFTPEEAVRLYKTHYVDVAEFKSSESRLAKTEWGKHVINNWAEAEVYTINDRLLFTQTRSRMRVFFWALKPVEVFKTLNPQLIDEQTIKADRTVWDAYGNPSTVQVERTYILWRVRAEALGADPQANTYVYGLQMECPSTGKQHLILIAENQLYQPSVGKALRFIYGGIQPADRHGDVFFHKPLPLELLPKIKDKANSFYYRPHYIDSGYNTPEEKLAVEVVTNIRGES